MAPVTGRFQIALPKRLVDLYDIHIGDEVELVTAGESIAIVPARSRQPELSAEERLRLFDETSRWLDACSGSVTYEVEEERGRAREELYTRGGPR